MKKVLSLMLAVVMVIGMLPLGLISASAVADGDSVKYTFSSYTAGTQYASGEVHVLDDAVTVTTTECHFTSQLRIYSSSSHNGYAIIDCTAEGMKFSGIAVNAGNKADTLVVYGSNDSGTTWEEAGKIATTSSYTDYTLAFSKTYSSLKLDVSGSQQVRLQNMTLTFADANAEACAHTETKEDTDGYAATCTTDGKTNSIICASCGATVTSQTVIPAIGHNYENDVCLNCGEAAPSVRATLLTALPTTGDIVYIYNADSDVVLTATASGTKLAGADATVADTLLYVTDEMAGLTVSIDGDYFVFVNNGQYLTSGATGNSLSFAAELTDYAKWSLVEGDTGVWYIKNASAVYNGTVQALEYYSGTFTTYGEGTGAAYKMQLFAQVAEGEEVCTHTNTTVLEAVAATCTTDGKTEGAVCADCSVIVTAQETVKATGHTYAEGVCSICSDVAPVIPTIPTTGNYELVTDIAEITAGGKFVIVADYNGINYAMGALTDGKCTATEVTVVNDMVAYTEGTTPVWTVASYGDGIVLVTDNGYLAYGTDGTSFYTASEGLPYIWSVAAVEGANTFNVNSAATTARYIALYSNYGTMQYGSYASSNMTSKFYNFGLSFYKLTEGEVVELKNTVSVVENGTTVYSEDLTVGSTYTLPEATKTVDGYTFAGWTTQTVEEIAVAPETVLAAGTAVTVGNPVTYYALYTRTEIVEGGAVYVLADDITDVNIGDTVIIAAANAEFALGTTQNKNNRKAEAAAKSDNTIAYNENVQLLTVENGNVAGTLAFNTGSGYLYAASSSSNYLRTETTLSDNSSWAVTFTDGAVTIVAQGTNTRNHMRYNGSSAGSELFAAYGATSTMQPVALYVKTIGTSETTYYTTSVEVAENFAVVVGGEETTYATMQEAVNNVGNGYVKLLANAEVDVTLDKDLYIDLNSYYLSGTIATNGKDIYGMDSTTDGYSCEDMGVFKCVDENGEVIVPVTQFKAAVNGNKRYLAIEGDNNSYTFHRFYMGLTHATVKPGVKGVGYKAVFAGDDMVKACVNSFGYNLQLGENAPVSVSKAGSELVSRATVTLRVDNYDAENMGETALAANVFMVINGQTVSADSYTTSLKAMVETINGIENLDAAKKEALAEWIASSETMKSWEVGNIYTEAEPTPEA